MRTSSGESSLKVLEVVPRFKLAGAERMAESLILGLHDEGVHVEAVSLYDFESSISEGLRDAGVTVHQLGKRDGLDFRMLARLRQLIRSTRPDIVHTHLYGAKYAVPASLLAHSGSKCVHTVHSIAIEELEKPDRRLQSLFYKRGWSFPVAISPNVRDTICDVYQMSADEVPIVHNGVAMSAPMSEGTTRADNDEFTFVHVGRYDPVKNHIFLLEAFAKLQDTRPATRLVLVGGGDLFPEVSRRIAELGLGDRVEQVGEVDNVRPYLQAADAFVLPSVFEGLPMTVIEAMGAGLPCVCTPVGGVPDVIQDGVNGLLREADADQFAQAMESLVADPALCEALSQGSRSSSALYTREAMTDGYLRVFRSVLGRPDDAR